MADGMPESHGPAAGKLKVFVSYSRDDLDFADQLVAALGICGFDPSIDRHGISGGEAWQQRLGALILEADTVVFVLSPSSARSPICAWEVEEAARLGKRILPVLARPLDGANPPQRLRDLNYVFFYAEPRSPGSGFGMGLTGLVESLNTDLGWIREHTRLLERATEWDVVARPVDRLLSGNDIAQAKAWAARRPKGAPEPTALHLDFIRASEEEATSRASSERQRLEKMAEALRDRSEALRTAEEAQHARDRARSLIAKISGGAAVALGAVAAVALYNWWEAGKQRAEAVANLKEAQITQSRSLVASAQQSSETGDWATSILLALEALPDPGQKIERPLVFEARTRLFEALDYVRERFVFAGDARLSPDGRLVLMIPADKAPRLWDSATGRQIFVLGLPDQPASNAAFSPDGKLVLTTPENDAPRLWETATGKQLFPLGGPEQAGEGRASFSSDSHRVMTALKDKAPRLWDSATGRELSRPGDPEEYVLAASFSPNGKFVLTRPRGQARLWDSETGRELLSLGGLELTITDASFNADSTVMLTVSDPGGVRLWSTATGEQLPVLERSEEPVASASFSPDGKHVLKLPKDQAPRLWDITSNKEPFVLGEAPARAFFFSPDSGSVLTLDHTNAPRLWDTSTGKQRFALGDNATINNAVFSPDSKLLVTLNSKATLWDATTGKERFTFAQGPTSVQQALFSPNGQRVFAATPFTAWLWNIQMKDPQFSFTADGHERFTLTFSPNGEFALTTASDRTARIWDLKYREHDPRPDRSTTLQAIMDRAKSAVPRCLSIEQRQKFLLRPAPPRWCIEMAKFPYDSASWRTKDAVDVAIAEKYGNFADAALKAGDFSRALEAADLGIRFGPDLTWIRMNRAHALMFLDRGAEARAEYLAHRGKVIPDHGVWDAVVIEEFAELRERGRAHPLMAQIEKQLQAAPKTP